MKSGFLLLFCFLAPVIGAIRQESNDGSKGVTEFVWDTVKDVLGYSKKVENESSSIYKIKIVNGTQGSPFLDSSAPDTVAHSSPKADTSLSDPDIYFCT